MNIDLIKQKINDELERSLDFKSKKLKSMSNKLDEALRYALLGKAKRIRPILTIISAQSLIKDWSLAFKYALPSALAIEYIHNYSLIHDDLPSMDNDDLRRGKPSLHVRFDEATAILVGDCLLSDAFFILAQAPKNASVQVKRLAESIGRDGLILGQMGDLAGHKDTWQDINLLKTAKLFEAALALGAISVNASSQDILQMSSLGLLWGQAFQLKDDLDDKTGSFTYLGRNNIEIALDEIKKAILLNLSSFQDKRIFQLFEAVIH